MYNKPSFKIENSSCGRVYFRALVTTFILTLKCIQQGSSVKDSENKALSSLFCCSTYFYKERSYKQLINLAPVSGKCIVLDRMSNNGFAGFYFARGKYGHVYLYWPNLSLCVESIRWTRLLPLPKRYMCMFYFINSKLYFLQIVFTPATGRFIWRSLTLLCFHCIPYGAKSYQRGQAYLLIDLISWIT